MSKKNARIGLLKRIHEVIGPLGQDDFQRLEDSIRAEGIHVPIIYRQATGEVIDGVHRQKIGRKYGKAAVRDVRDVDEKEAAKLAVTLNVARRHLTPEQKRELTGLLRSPELPPEERFTQEEVAEMLGETHRAVGKREKGSIGKSSNTSLVDLRMKVTPQHRKVIVERTEAGEPHAQVAADFGISRRRAGQIVEEEKRLRDREAKEERAKGTSSDLLTEKKYRVIYADPPWKYSSGSPAMDHYGPAERHYPCLSIEELCALDIEKMAEDNAVLFLWVTSPMLAECWSVIKAWGFTYKASFVWDKVKHNYGHYNSVRHEFLLVCTRGSCLPDTQKLQDSVISLERSGKHSEKPEFFRSLIEDLYTHGERIELFARETAEGWEQHGNEIL